MNKIKRWLAYILLLFISSVIPSCTYEKVETPAPTGCYPDDIASIFLTKCATPGCHTSQSKDGAGGFDLSTWDHLFEGGRNGSSVIPFREDQSFLMYFINTYSDLNIPIATPTMPVNGTPLSRNEVTLVRDWIHNGAPDCNGHVKFSDDPNRKKYYVCNQGCDLVTVFDSQTKLPMRVIDVGVNPNQIEGTHNVQVSPDGNFWYVIFTSAQVMQKFRTSDDSFVGNITLGAGSWNAMTISKDSRYAFVVNYGIPLGTVALVDLQAMTLLVTYTGLRSPHGCDASDDFKTLYVTAQTGNYIYKYDITDPMNPVKTDIILENGTQVFSSKFDPHQVEITPDGTKYFVSCQRTNEVRVMSVATDTLLAVIPTGGNPQELEVSETYPYMFVSCMNDSVTFPGSMGSVAVINYQTNHLIKSVFTDGWQPHGLAVDDYYGLVYVANRNVNSNGPAPHHTSTCSGRNGNVTIIDMKATDPALMNILDYKVEVSVDPYEVSVRN